MRGHAAEAAICEKNLRAHDKDIDSPAEPVEDLSRGHEREHMDGSRGCATARVHRFASRCKEGFTLGGCAILYLYYSRLPVCSSASGHASTRVKSSRASLVPPPSLWYSVAESPRNVSSGSHFFDSTTLYPIQVLPDRPGTRLAQRFAACLNPTFFW